MCVIERERGRWRGRVSECVCVSVCVSVSVSGVLNSDKVQIVVQSRGYLLLRPVFWRKSEIVKLRLSWFFARF